MKSPKPATRTENPHSRHCVLVDGNNLAYRLNSTLELTAPDGSRVSSVYGIISALLQWRKSFKYFPGTPIIFFWDRGHAKARRELFPGYKQRERKPEDEEWMVSFRQQCRLLEELLPALGCRVIYGAGVESDDLIASWAEGMADDGETLVTVISGDSDYEQLVGEHVRVLRPGGLVLTEEQVIAERGVPPSSMAAWKALVGDGSDKIPGVPGIGEKRATQLLQEFPELGQCGLPPKSRWMSHPSAKLLRKVLDDWDTFERNYKLIKLPSDLVVFNRKELTILPPNPNKEKVRGEFRRLAFVQFLARYNEFWAYISGEAVAEAAP